MNKVTFQSPSPEADHRAPDLRGFCALRQPLLPQQRFAAATMGRAAERAQRDRKALLWQQRLAKSRAEASKIGGSVVSLRRR